MERESITNTIIAVTKVFQNGKTTIPKMVRERFGIRDGERIVWYLDQTGRLGVSVGDSVNSVNLGTPFFPSPPIEKRFQQNSPGYRRWTLARETFTQSDDLSD